MKVISFNGLSLNTGNYEAVLLYSNVQPPKDIVSLPRHGGYSKIVSINYTTAYRLPVLQVQINSNLSTATRALFAAFNTTTATAALVVADDDGSNERYVMAAVQTVDQIPNSNKYQYAATLLVDGDPYWRAVTASTDEWAITASGQTNAVTVVGDLDVYPTYTITATSAKTGGDVYTRTGSYQWANNVTYEQCPVRFSLDTAALILASKITDATNIAAYVDGTEVRRWVSGTEFDTDDTGIWINLDFAPGFQATYSGFNDAANTALGSGDSVTTLVMSSDISRWPQAGIVRLGTELFTWEGVDRTQKRLLGVTRAYGSTTAAAHAVGDIAYWVQHDIQIAYGPGVTAATTFPQDTYANGEIIPYDGRKPMITMGLSTNTSWLWGDFGEDRGTRLEQKPRAARWKGRIIGDSHTLVYGSNPPPTVYDYIGVGIDSDKREIPRGWRVQLPYTLSALGYNVYGQQQWPDDTEQFSDARRWRLFLSTSNEVADVVQVDFPEPSIQVGAFEDFTNGESWIESGVAAVASPGDSLNFKLGGVGRLSCRLDNLTATFSQDISTALGTETSAYQLAATLANTTTGESITIDLPVALDEPLIIDTAAYTVTYAGSNQYQAIRRSSVRQPLLRLAPGANTLQFTDTGTEGVTVDIEWRERYY